MKQTRFGAASIAALFLAACSGDSNSTSAVLPSVSAGADIQIAEGDDVEVAGSASLVNGSVSLAWTQVSGPMVTLSGVSSSTVSFRAPRVRNSETVVLRLTATGSNSAISSDDISITIANTGNGPEGPSPQGIPDNGRDRRGDARGGRGTPRVLATREVRTYDGSSNNAANAEWGATFIHLQRLAPADYSDGISGLAGTTRPSARAISNAVVAQADGVSVPNTFGGTDFVWQWGQFIDHDLDLTDGAEEAADIAVPSGDPEFDPASTGAEVIAFNRALFDPDSGTGTANPREQENEITSWIDGSNVYGSSDDRIAALRVSSDNPFLATSDGNLLPFNANSLTNANGFITDPTRLFLAGDIRANEQVGLAVMHTLFVREHNRLAADLQRDFPGNTPDEIFEVARRLNIAQMQIITFEEWLPALIGPGAIPAYAGYDNTVNPSIFNEFSVAAFRLGHSMLNEQLLRLDASGGEIPDGHLDLANAFFTAPGILASETDLDPILRGLATQPHQALDETIVNDVRNFLFGVPGDGGLDLASLNIQRGRDHGVASYNDMRAALGLTRYTDFSQVTSDAGVQIALSAAYGGDIDDIDLWVGGLCEDAVAGSQLGELFQTIMVRQFTALRDGDRFWYENDLDAGERARVDGTTLADIIRRNTAIGSELQDNVFETP